MVTYTVKDIYKALPDTKFDFDPFGFLHIQADEDVKIEIDPNVLPLQHKFVNFDVGTFQVESDIVTPIITGLKKLPILRRFKPLSCALGAIRQEFTHLQYREVRKKRFQSLRIVINTGEGQPGAICFWNLDRDVALPKKETRCQGQRLIFS